MATVKKFELADIKPGTYVGIATRTGANGELQAIEVLVFPEAMRGAGEGHYAWDLEPGSMMTNGTVTGDGGRDIGTRAERVVQGRQQQDRRAARRADRDLRARREGRPEAGRQGDVRCDARTPRASSPPSRVTVGEGWRRAADVTWSG